MCDHPYYCKTDTTAIYLGQDHRHISHPSHRNDLRYFPSGWSDIKDNWNGRCSYTASHNGASALCNSPTNTHSWRTPSQGPTSFVCARVVGWADFLGSSQETFKSTNHREQLGQVQHARLDLPTETNPHTELSFSMWFKAEALSEYSQVQDRTLLSWSAAHGPVSTYYMANANTLCPSSDILTTAEECRTGGKTIKNNSDSSIEEDFYVQNIVDYPAGCSYNEAANRLRWNSIGITGESRDWLRSHRQKNQLSTYRPICKSRSHHRMIFKGVGRCSTGSQFNLRSSNHVRFPKD